MTRSRVSTIVVFVVAFGLLAALGTPAAKADFTFGAPVRLGPLVPGADTIDCFSSDGLEMYIDSQRAGGQGDYDLWVLKRASVDEDWGPQQNLGPAVNSAAGDYYASISADGLTLYFSSWREGSSSDWVNNDDTYVTTRATRNDPWGPAVNMGPLVNSSGHQDRDPWISPDGLELYFMSWRSGGYGESDLWVARRPTEEDPWSEPVNLGPVVNTPYNEAYLSLSPDGLLLLFSESFSVRPRRPGGCGGSDMWMARRASLSAPWQTPVNLGPKINSPSDDTCPRLSPDGRTLYFCSDRTGWEYWQVAIDPILDFNGDGKVNDQDIAILREHWGQNYPLCDIGPMPWGDGMVDAEDLKVLTKQAVDPPPFALEVPRDVILNWASSAPGETYDVYFGTSFADVGSATRDNPLGVLVSRGQTATTYDPKGLLEFGRTYYWRIDEVGPGPAFVLSRGSVLNFTTEAFAFPIAHVTATASSSIPGWGPEKTIDGSGLDKMDGHSTAGADMWLSGLGGVQPSWIQYEFDQVYKLHELWVWNHNLQVESMLGFGCRDVALQYSANGTDWTTLADVEFARAPGQGGYTHNTTVKFKGVAARYVRLTAKSNWGGTSLQYGLSEVRFFHVPVRASLPTPASGRTGAGLEVVLRWKAGREAALHQVYLSTDREAVASGKALVTTVSDARFNPGPLDLGRTYYWKVNEVNEAERPSTWEGEVWSFSTRESVVVESFESYTNEEGKRIYETWIDGYTNKLSGSTVGHFDAPFAERMVIHGGQQSMPLTYDNTATPFYSETTRDLGTPQDWTGNGATHMDLWFRGYPAMAAVAVTETAGKMTLTGDGTDIWNSSDEFVYAYKTLNGDGSIVARVVSIGTGSNTWAKGGVMIRDSLNGGSMFGDTVITGGGGNGASFQYRLTTNEAVGNADATAVLMAPYWVRIDRKGDTITGYLSADGKAWTRQGTPQAIAMTAPVYLGLCVTSHAAGEQRTMQFDNITTTGSVTGSWQGAQVSAPQYNDPASLYVVVQDSSGKSKLMAHADPAAAQAIDWQKWTIPLGEFQGVNLAGVKKMTIGVGDRDLPTPGGKGVIYIDDISLGHPLSAE